MKAFGSSLLFLIASFGQCGCLSWHSTHDVRISVRDAETDTPLSAASVEVRYQTIMVLPVWNYPEPCSATTNTEGIADLKVADVKSQSLCVKANGYQSFERRGDVWTGRDLDVRLYRQPSPQITIVVPHGYRGILKLDLRPSSRWVQGAAGQRTFTFSATANGSAEIEASPLLLRMHDLIRNDPSAIRAVLQCGQAVPHRIWSHDPELIALRHVDSWENRSVWVIGTYKDAQDIGRTINEVVPDGLRADSKRFNAVFDRPLPDPASSPRLDR